MSSRVPMESGRGDLKRLLLLRQAQDRNDRRELLAMTTYLTSYFLWG